MRNMYSWTNNNNMNKMMTYYQPCRYINGGKDLEWGSVPNGLFSFMAFPTKEECEMWLELNGYDPKEYAIIMFQDDDIEDVTIIDAHGDVFKMDDDQSTDKAIFQFDSSKYDASVTTLSREVCEHLADTDEDNVTKFNLDFDTSLQELLNDDMLDTTNCFFRVFI